MKRFSLIFILALLFNFLLIEGALAAGSGLGPAAMKYWGTNLPEDSLLRENPARMVPVQEIKSLIDQYNPRLSEAQKIIIIEAILNSSQRHSLDPLLVASVIAAESSFRPGAHSHCDARGLMQLTKMVWPYVGVQDPYDIEQNIEGGCIFLSRQAARFQSIELSLAAYNAGPGIVGKLKRIPNYPETINYVKKVTRLANKLSEKYEARKAAATAAYLAANIKSPDPVVNFMPSGRLNEWRRQTHQQTQQPTHQRAQRQARAANAAVDGGEACSDDDYRDDDNYGDDGGGNGGDGGWYEVPAQCLPDHKRTLGSI
ncbi:MAG TPA: hypothetical protein DHD79_09470 [Firmicutes bacterium]|nr:hypothetical protein [Bacillota bacterium]